MPLFRDQALLGYYPTGWEGTSFEMLLGLLGCIVLIGSVIVILVKVLATGPTRTEDWTRTLRRFVDVADALGEAIAWRTDEPRRLLVELREVSSRLSTFRQWRFASRYIPWLVEGFEKALQGEEHTNPYPGWRENWVEGAYQEHLVPDLSGPFPRMLTQDTERCLREAEAVFRPVMGYCPQERDHGRFADEAPLGRDPFLGFPWGAKPAELAAKRLTARSNHTALEPECAETRAEFLRPRQKAVMVAGIAFEHIRCYFDHWQRYHALRMTATIREDTMPEGEDLAATRLTDCLDSAFGGHRFDSSDQWRVYSWHHQGLSIALRLSPSRNTLLSESRVRKAYATAQIRASLVPSQVPSGTGGGHRDTPMVGTRPPHTAEYTSEQMAVFERVGQQ